MKKFGKIFLIVLVVIVALLAALPLLFKDKIVAKVKEEANKNLNAKLDFGNFDLSLLRSFPDFSLRLENLSLINGAPFEGDTLIAAGKLELTVDIMSIIRGTEIGIKTILLDRASMNFKVNKAEMVNWDIVKTDQAASEAGEPAAFKGKIKKYAISNSTLVYDDRSLDFYLKLKELNHQGKGDFTEDLFTLSTQTEVKSVDMSYEGLGYISGAQSSIQADLDMDMKNFKFTFKENKVSLNALQLGVNGFVAMPDTNIDMDLQFFAEQSDFKNFISMIPAIYKSDMNSMQAEGSMALKGHLKGRYNAVSMPGFGLELMIDKGKFRYPSLPSAVENVKVDLKINNPDGIDDHTVINLAAFHMEMAGDPFDARLVLKNPVSNPDVDTYLKGKINLANVSKVVPLESGTQLSGTVLTDFSAKGKINDLKQNNFDRFEAGGTLDISNLMYSSSQDNSSMNITKLLMSFSPKLVALKTLQAQVGKSDFSATGSLEQFIPYLFSDATLKGSLNLTSKLIDLNPFMAGEEAAKPADTTTLAVLEIPGNIDFNLSASIGQLIYQDLSMYNVNGTLLVRDQAVRMQQVNMQMMDGFIQLSGSYSAEDLTKPRFDMDIAIRDFNIQKTAAAFPTVKNMAPIAKYCTGTFSTLMDARGLLSQNMQPIISSLNGGGRLNTSKITVQGFPSFEKVADILKIPALKSVEIPSVNPSFKFIDGRVYVEPVDIQINGMKTTVAGSNGFDQTIDYTMAMAIPRSAFGGAANSVLNNLVSSANAKGANFSLGETVPLNILLKGTVMDPKVSTDLKGQGSSAMEDMKAKAKEEFDRKKEEAEARAREEADKLKKEAASRLEEEKGKAAAEADRLKKEAEAKAKAAADSAKKAAEQKAKDALKDMNPFKKK